MMLRTTIVFAGLTVVVGLADAPKAPAWGGYHQFSDYYNPASSPDYVNPGTSRSPDYYNPSNARANNPFSDYFNPSAWPQNGQSGPYGYSPSYFDPSNTGGYSRRW
jgi:hypothetical protein